MVLIFKDKGQIITLLLTYFYVSTFLAFKSHVQGAPKQELNIMGSDSLGKFLQKSSYTAYPKKYASTQITKALPYTKHYLRLCNLSIVSRFDAKFKYVV